MIISTAFITAAGKTTAKNSPVKLKPGGSDAMNVKALKKTVPLRTVPSAVRIMALANFGTTALIKL